MPAIEFPKTVPEGTRIPVYPGDVIEPGIYYEHVYDLWVLETIPDEEAIRMVDDSMSAALRKLDLTLYAMGGVGARGMFCVIFYNIGPTIYKHRDLDAEFSSELAERSGYAFTGTDAIFLNEWRPKKFAWWLLGIGAFLATVLGISATKRRKK